jgi:hypothetical protein
VAVSKKPVEDGGGDDRIAEDLAPFTDGAVGGDQQATRRSTGWAS